MKTHTKAFLLSTFVCPGAGHWVLKRYKSSVFLMSVTFIAAGFVFYRIMSIALKIVSEIQQRQITPDVFAIRQQIVEQLSGSQTDLLNGVLLLIIVIWFISIVDVYRLIRKK